VQKATLATLSWLLDAIFPPRCLACPESVSEQGSLCQPCWEKLHPLAPPFCQSCGVPLTPGTPEDSWCGRCLLNPPPYAKARSAMIYEDTAQHLVARLKYADGTALASAMAKWMVQSFHHHFKESEMPDYVMPIPLHWRRLLWRKYNQSGLLAKEFSLLSGIPYECSALRRRFFAPRQTGLSRRGRERNIRHQFDCHPRFNDRIKEAHILLVDDVMTTGATLREASQCLLRAGAGRVSALCFARTPL
jgi:ComF family protein